MFLVLPYSQLSIDVQLNKIIRGVERGNLRPASGPMVLLRYMLESNACGDASERREPSTEFKHKD